MGLDKSRVEVNTNLFMSQPQQQTQPQMQPQQPQRVAPKSVMPIDDDIPPFLRKIKGNK